MRFCAELLAEVGFNCQLIPQGEGRSNLIATRGVGNGAALGFTGHLDTVPLGAAEWHYPPHESAIHDGRLYGRGATDMKGGIAAFIVACQTHTETPPGGIAILLTAGEETGGDGARVMVERATLPPVGALIVGEPTANRPVPGHKGAFWLTLRFQGVTAHGSMPQEGKNAIAMAAETIRKLSVIDLGPAHPVMGPPTLNVGTIRGGMNVNSVPDQCDVGLDMRSVPGVRHEDLMKLINDVLPQEASIDVNVDLQSIWTAPETPWIAALTRIAVDIAGADPSPSAVSYFTDASVLTPALDNPPTIILGPGEPTVAHKTDEYVLLSRLEEAVTIYRKSLEDWTGQAA
jgi:succinyl-diaminopimelate desuccinylase